MRKKRNCTSFPVLTGGFLLILSLVACSTNKPVNNTASSVTNAELTDFRPQLEVEDPIVGVKIYDYKKDFPTLFDKWEDLGINTVFASADLCSNSEFRRAAQARGIKLFVILPIFQNPEALKADPGLFAIMQNGKNATEDWVTFVCPSRRDYLEKRIDYIEDLITKTDPDGISIDFIRHFVFWEMIYPDRTLGSLPNSCFCSHCMKGFQDDTGIQLPEEIKSPEKTAKWINETHLARWTEWKCDLIARTIGEIVASAKKIKPDIAINIHIVPWRAGDYDGAIKKVVGQDFAKLSKYADFLSPMVYHHMVKQDTAWIHSVVEDVDRQASCPVLPSIQVAKAYLDEEVTAAEFSNALQNALAAPSAGVVFWNWKSLDRDAEKKAILKKVLHK